jgi:CDP-paratose 2-epimerase
MTIAVITGSAGLIGSEACRHFAERGLEILGIDNDMRSKFFGSAASTKWQLAELEKDLGERYTHHDLDIRDRECIENLFTRYGSNIGLVIHTAAQPSHDWAAREPHTDFTINANGTLNLLEATRLHCPDAVFIFTSTNKVYGDMPNHLPLVELETRWEIDQNHRYADGIQEDMSVDNSTHSLFGASKVAADILVQEYGRYFGLKTVCFRGGCLTGPNHSGAQLHGFLAYLMKCTMTAAPYSIFGYSGKQVRDNIHSFDLIHAFDQFFNAPRSAEVYNIGGSRHSHCSMLEAIQMCQEITGRKLAYTYHAENRTGDHIWYVSDVSRFQSHYPQWKLTFNTYDILSDIYHANSERWSEVIPA